jgi:hypothetical protein
MDRQGVEPTDMDRGWPRKLVPVTVMFPPEKLQMKSGRGAMPATVGGILYEKDTLPVTVRLAPSAEAVTPRLLPSMHWSRDGSTEQGLKMHVKCVSLTHETDLQRDAPIAASGCTSVVPKFAP